ncbi:hypothetical protein QBC32DRAFT_146258 [Pseudoneurospora amorphoporcata]|uniref:DUF7719 domain-containing protein n=1 Tax=Pseudoneurospora amorphoporcata TaxID=241081 RepID=A0AAN6NY39_9PEZI|nr:hypothetical protein QBC32DRAFT_146258 [Pseudoneurospora amorphoporcata]
MGRKRAESPSNIKFQYPDRSGPKEKTLLELAEERGLFAQAQKKQEENDLKAKAPNITKIPITKPKAKDDQDNEPPPLSPGAERFLETTLYTMSITMLHFTLDVLVQNQYSADRIVWPKVCMRALQALFVFGLLIYTLHAHSSNPTILPGLPARFQNHARQVIFLVTSVCSGCYLIHITNTYGYLAVMKQAPPVGCLWVWSVVELELPWAVLSLAVAGTYLKVRGYDIK